MADTINEAGAQYSSGVGLIFIFNLIVGTGALTMPKAFASAGWLLSLILVVCLAFMSYLTATLVIEAMASANAILRWKKQQAEQAKRSQAQAGLREEEDDYHSNSAEQENRPLLDPVNVDDVHRTLAANDPHLFDTTERVEMGGMASLFFHPFGVKVFYVCIAVYLYGDLAIYAAAVPKSLRDVACTWNGSHNDTVLPESAPCWEGIHITRLNAYRLFLAAFTLALGPFAFFNPQKTTYLQLFTAFLRWTAFLTMIILATMRLAAGKGEGHPRIADISGVPTLFGVCVYSFMCHHSLPSLATPIKNKSSLFSLFAGDYALILAFYVLLSFTGIYCFGDVDDLYTLNFKPGNAGGHSLLIYIDYFLALFPVFTLSTNFPIICITLRNNLKTMLHREGRAYSWGVDRIVFPLLALAPPTLVAFITHDVEVLVGVTGSYAGAGVQYIVPVALAYCSRRHICNVFGDDVKNPHTSPFAHLRWLIFIMAWAAIAIVLVTIYHIIERQ